MVSEVFAMTTQYSLRDKYICSVYGMQVYCTWKLPVKYMYQKRKFTIALYAALFISVGENEE